MNNDAGAPGLTGAVGLTGAAGCEKRSMPVTLRTRNANRYRIWM